MMTISPTTRASLLLRLRDPRDYEAWVEFVALYEPVVYRVLRRANSQDADTLEVMQDLFLAVHRNIERWKTVAEHGSFRGWLRHVTRNLVVSRVRRKRRQIATTSVDLDLLLQASCAGDSPETDEFDGEFRRILFQKPRSRFAPRFNHRLGKLSSMSRCPVTRLPQLLANLECQTAQCVLLSAA